MGYFLGLGGVLFADVLQLRLRHCLCVVERGVVSGNGFRLNINGPTFCICSVYPVVGYDAMEGIAGFFLNITPPIPDFTPLLFGGSELFFQDGAILSV